MLRRMPEIERRAMLAVLADKFGAELLEHLAAVTHADVAGRSPIDAAVATGTAGRNLSQRREGAKEENGER